MNSVKNILIPVGGLILALILSSVDLGTDIHSLPLYGAPAIVGSATEDNSEEPEKGEIFSAPVPISWKAEVVGCLMGCSGYILKRTDDTGAETVFQGFNADGAVKDMSGSVEVKGMWIGIDCGYSKTIFGGKCAPSVVIDEIQQTGN